MDTPRPAPIRPPRVCLRSPGGRTASRGRQPWEAGVWGVGHGAVLLPRCPGSEAPEGRVAGRAGGSGEGPAGADSPWLYSRWTSRTVCALADLRKRPSERSPAGSAPRVSHGSPHIGIPRRSMTARRRPCRELLPTRLVSPLTTHPQPLILSCGAPSCVTPHPNPPGSARSATQAPPLSRPGLTVPDPGPAPVTRCPWVPALLGTA